MSWKQAGVNFIRMAVLLVLVLVINLITDILYSFLDPRVNL